MSLSQFCPKSVFITGCNTGIGLEMVKQLLVLPNSPEHLLVTYRNPKTVQELQELAKNHSNLHLIQFDVTNLQTLPDVVKKTEEILEGQGLNLLINNAGVLIRSKLDEVTAEEMMDNFEVNAIAPLMITQAFTSLLKKAALTHGDSGMSCSKSAIINMGSKVGSCADNRFGALYPCRTSKAALNMITKTLSVDLKDYGILAAVLHPGYVETRMTGPKALITPEVSVQGMITVMAGLDQEKTGMFFDYKGLEIPW